MPPLPRNLLLAALLIVVIPIAACTEPTPTPTPVPPIPDNTTWILESINGNPIIETSFVMLNFEDDWITGYDGCNRYSGRLEDETPITDPHGALSFPSVAITQRDCPDLPGVTDQADAYIAALSRGKTYRLTDDQLEILNTDGETTLLFTQQPTLQGRPIDLTGTAWRLLTDSDANPTTLAFLDHRILTGDTPCRSYLATYTTDNETIRFPSKAMLKPSQSCSDEARTLEGAFGDFLTWAREYAFDLESGSQQLNIRSAEGETLTFEWLSPAVQNISDTEWTLTAIIELSQLEFGMWNTRETQPLKEIRITLSPVNDPDTESSDCDIYSSSFLSAIETFDIDPPSTSPTLELCRRRNRITDHMLSDLEPSPGMALYTTHGNTLSIQTSNDTFLLFQAE